MTTEVTTNTAWKCLTVQDFLAQCNWENVSSPLLVPGDVKVTKAKSLLQSWQCMTTQDFFGLNNWSGQVIFTTDGEQQELTSETFEFDLTSSTDQFWKCFNWSGSVSNTVESKVDRIIQETKEIIAEVEEFTLKDLSQLF